MWILYEPDLQDKEPQAVDENPFMKLRASLKEAEMDAGSLKDSAYCGHVGEESFIKYYGIQRPSKSCMILPKDKTYRIEMIDTREKKRTVIAEGASGIAWFILSGKEKMAVLAVAEG